MTEPKVHADMCDAVFGPAAVPNPCQDLEDRCQPHIRTPARSFARLAQPRCNAAATLCCPPPHGHALLPTSHSLLKCNCHCTLLSQSPIQHPSSPCSLLAAPPTSRGSPVGVSCASPHQAWDAAAAALRLQHVLPAPLRGANKLTSLGSLKGKLLQDANKTAVAHTCSIRSH